jgi:hypothetical protein
MEIFLSLTNNPRILQKLNHICLALQVTFLSELFHDNSQLNPGAPAELTGGKPRLHLLSTSKLKWPFQPIPGMKTLNLWKKYMLQIPPPTPRPWTEDHSLQRRWQKYSDPTLNSMYIQTPKGYTIHEYRRHARRHHRFSIPSSGGATSLPNSAIPALGLTHRVTVNPAPSTIPPVVHSPPTTFAINFLYTTLGTGMYLIIQGFLSNFIRYPYI